MSNFGEAREREYDEKLQALFEDLQGGPVARPSAKRPRASRHLPRPALIAVPMVVLLAIGVAVGAWELTRSGRPRAVPSPQATSSSSCIASIRFQGRNYVGVQLQSTTLQKEAILGSATVPACGDSEEGGAGSPSTVQAFALEGIDPAIAVAVAGQDSLYLLAGRCSNFTEGPDLSSCLRERLSFGGGTYRSTQIKAPAGSLDGAAGSAELIGADAPGSKAVVSVSRLSGVGAADAVAAPDGEIYVADSVCEVWGIPRVLDCLKKTG